MGNRITYSVLLFSLLFSLPAMSNENAPIMLSSNDVVTQRTISLKPNIELVNLAKTMQLHAHPDSPKRLADVFESKEKARFEWVNDEALNSGFQTAPVYGYVLIDNQSLTDEWYIRIHYALLDHIDIYQIDDFGPTPKPLKHIVSMGDSLPFSTRDMKVPSFVHRLKLAKDATTLVVIRIQTQGSRYSDIYLHRADNLAEIEAGRGLGLGL